MEERARDGAPLVPSDTAAFAREVLGFVPDEQQSLVLGAGAHRGLLNCSRQWGKSTVTAAMALHRGLSRPGSLVLVVSPSARQSREFLRKARGFAVRMGIKPKRDGDNEISLALPGESRIVGIPGKEATVRGFSAVSLMLIDEAARVNDDLYRAVRPMLAVGDGDLWLISTPFGKRGFFWKAWELEGERWTRFQVRASECPRISKEFLAEEREVLGEQYFQQEYECEFQETAFGAFDVSLLLKAVDLELKPWAED